MSVNILRLKSTQRMEEQIERTSQEEKKEYARLKALGLIQERTFQEESAYGHRELARLKALGLTEEQLGQSLTNTRVRAFKKRLALAQKKEEEQALTLAQKKEEEQALTLAVAQEQEQAQTQILARAQERSRQAEQRRRFEEVLQRRAERQAEQQSKQAPIIEEVRLKDEEPERRAKEQEQREAERQAERDQRVKESTHRMDELQAEQERRETPEYKIRVFKAKIEWQRKLYDGLLKGGHCKYTSFVVCEKKKLDQLNESFKTFLRGGCSAKEKLAGMTEEEKDLMYERNQEMSRRRKRDYSLLINL